MPVEGFSDRLQTENVTLKLTKEKRNGTSNPIIYAPKIQRPLSSEQFNRIEVVVTD
jgi:hypothetical protein